MFLLCEGRFLESPGRYVDPQKVEVQKDPQPPGPRAACHGLEDADEDRHVNAFLHKRRSFLRCSTSFQM